MSFSKPYLIYQLALYTLDFLLQNKTKKLTNPRKQNSRAAAAAFQTISKSTHNTITNMSDISEPQHMGVISQIYDQTFDNFYLHDKNLGQGGQGDISLAKIRATGKLVVIKRLRLPPNADLKTVPELVMLEKIQKLGAHPNILSYLQIWNTPQAAPGECPTSRIILPYLPSGDLLALKKSFLKMNVKVPEAFIFHAYKHIVSAVNFLHENGISHRDIKPENIMVDPVPFGSSLGPSPP
jgi:serine/threonine protein kinase